MKILRNIFMVILGCIIGSFLNMGLIVSGPKIIPPPPGVDMTSQEGILLGMPLLEARHFIFPFLAHALGTLLGAFIAAKLGVGNKMRLAMIVGVLFLCAGIANIYMLPGHPAWFAVVDILFAYLPMAWLGGRWGSK